MGKKPNRDRDADPIKGAMRIFAITAATDEEYAAGLHRKDPKSIIRGDTPKKPKRKKR